MPASTPPKKSKNAGRKADAPKTAAEHVSENAETIVIAVILAVLIRFFVIEAFQIPTGSMAPGLLGQHTSITCPNCRHGYTVGQRHEGALPQPLDIHQTQCPLCGENPDAIAERGGDHIFVNKVLYQVRPPERWEVFVFKYPGDLAFRRQGRIPVDQLEKNYIKRCIGLPGDVLRIVDGDIFESGRILRKTDRAQKALWHKVFDLDHYRRQESYPPSNDDVWQWEGMTWIFPKSREIDISFRPDGDVSAGRLRFVREIDDAAVYNSGQRRPPLRLVTDMAAEWILTPESPGGAFRMTMLADKAYLRADGGAPARQVVFGIDLLAGQGYLQLGEGDGAIREMFDLAHAVGQTRRYRFENADYRARLFVDGRLAAEIDYWEALGIEIDDALYRAAAVDRPIVNGNPAIEAEGFSGRISSLRLYRDIYYINDADSLVWGRRGEQFELGPGEYFAMGDNSPLSSDSRMWGLVPEENILGRAMFVWPWFNSYRFKAIR